MRAINASIMRQVNRKLILNHIRLRPISRAELAEATCLTRASVTQIIEELIGEGVVVETIMVGRARLGRRSTQLAINPDAGAMFGVNLSRTQCNVGAINMRGEALLHNAEIVVGREPEDVLDAVANTILRQKEALQLSDGQVLGVGICAPGPVDVEEGRLGDPAGFEAWHHLPVAKMLSERIGMPVYLQSTANAQALEEKYFARMEGRFVLICVDEGVCASVVADGEWYAKAVELGRFAVNGEDWDSRLEKFLSMPALLAGTGCRAWAELMDHGDAAAKRVAVDRLVRYLSLGIANLACAFRIRKVVLTGELTYHAEEWSGELKRGIKRRIGEEVDILMGMDLNQVRMGAVSAYDRFFRTE